jgi:hypothetical protein
MAVLRLIVPAHGNCAAAAPQPLVQRPPLPVCLDLVQVPHDGVELVTVLRRADAGAAAEIFLKRVLPHGERVLARLAILLLLELLHEARSLRLELLPRTWETE